MVRAGQNEISARHFFVRWNYPFFALMKGSCMVGPLLNPNYPKLTFLTLFCGQSLSKHLVFFNTKRIFLRELRLIARLLGCVQNDYSS